MASCLVSQVLFEVMRAVKIDLNLSRLSPEVRLPAQWLILNSSGKGRMDYVVIAQLQVGRAKREALMIEVKVGSAARVYQSASKLCSGFLKPITTTDLSTNSQRMGCVGYPPCMYDGSHVELRSCAGSFRFS